MSTGENRFSREVGAQETRKLRARRETFKTVWFGFGMFGLVGWSVAVPTLLGALLGLKLDEKYPGPHSWTLTLIVIGLAVGALNAWHWVLKESRVIQEDRNA
jgi:ATP synthase protein I